MNASAFVVCGEDFGVGRRAVERGHEPSMKESRRRVKANVPYPEGISVRYGLDPDDRGTLASVLLQRGLRLASSDKSAMLIRWPVALLGRHGSPWLASGKSVSASSQRMFQNTAGERILVMLSSNLQIAAVPLVGVDMHKIKVLFLGANPAAYGRLHLDEEIRQITARLRSSDYRESIEFITCLAVRPNDILQALLEHRPHVVHFSGHGNSAEEIIVLDDAGTPKPVSKAALAHIFRTLKDNIRVVLLNACYSRPQAEAISEIIDCTVGMNSPIGDVAAIVFAASFYQALGFGRSVGESFDLGKAALMLEGNSEERTPELLTRAGVDASQLVLVPVSDTSFVPPVSQPRVVKATILRGSNAKCVAIELLLVNPSAFDLLIDSATIGCWLWKQSDYFGPPPVYSYDVSLQIECGTGDGTGSVTGVAREPLDDWGRPIQGRLVLAGQRLDFDMHIPLYLAVLRGESGLIRFVIRAPKQSLGERSIARRDHQNQYEAVPPEGAPVFGTEYYSDLGGTWIQLRGNWKGSATAVIADLGLLRMLDVIEGRGRDVRILPVARAATKPGSQQP